MVCNVHLGQSSNRRLGRARPIQQRGRCLPTPRTAELTMADLARRIWLFSVLATVACGGGSTLESDCPLQEYGINRYGSECEGDNWRTVDLRCEEIPNPCHFVTGFW